MRSTLLALIIACTIVPAVDAPAQEIAGQTEQPHDAPTPEMTAALGRMHFSIEFATMGMQHRDFSTDDAGVYFGISGYGHLGKDWYLGGEYGAGTSMAFFFADESSFYPLELNAKRGFRLSEVFCADLGAGLSYSRVKFQSIGFFSEDGEEIEEWVFGGQIFGDLMIEAGGVFLGLCAKYQLTTDASDVADELEETDGWDYTNYRIGLKIGFMFGN
jgi:hypothetical protein